MSKIDKIDLIIEKIQDLKDLHSEKIDNLDDSMSDFKDKLYRHQKTEEIQLNEIREDLNQHMDRTRAAEQSLNLLRQLHQDNQRRIETNEDHIERNIDKIEKSGEKMNKISTKVLTLEEPSKARKYLMKGLKGLGASAIAVLSIMKFIDYFKINL